MRALLLALHSATAPEAGSAHEREWRCEQTQTLATARHMRDGGQLAPLVVCRPGTPLAQHLRDEKLPFLTVESDGLWTALGLWRHYRPHNKLLLVSMGQTGMRLARRIKGLRRHLSRAASLCVHAFFVHPPEVSQTNFALLRQARHIMYGSEYVRLQLDTALGRANEIPALASLPETELTLVPPGAHWPATSVATHARQLDGKRFVLGMGAALGARSGVRGALQAIARLLEAPEQCGTFVELRLVGHGPRYDEVLAEATRLGLERRLAILGEQDLADVLPCCHAWMAPGSAPDEAPETLACALAAGVPVVAANGLLHRERLQDHNGAALQVQENDIEAWTAALRRLLEEPDLRASLVAQGSRLWPQLSLEHSAKNVCAHLEQWCKAHDWVPGPSHSAHRSTE